ncbi:MAG: uroporphyrinogen decarboxylase [Bdellovibrionaceae bacterium]|nr:uroporphyrinogen decarboxylase [Pseudobdellovibrionaceae bacterium]
MAEINSQVGNTRFQFALQQIPQAVPPIWFMRQAGRYHCHYQNLRAKHSFEELCKVPELAAEVAWGPIQDFDFDVAILFSDILFPLEALGFGLQYTDQGPKLGFHLDPETFQRLKPASEVKEQLNFQGEAMRMTRARLPNSKSLIGFVGGLWTLFVYACEGSHAGSLTRAKALLPLVPSFNTEMLTLLKWTIRRQLEGGAEVVMIFDTAAGELSPANYKEFVLPGLTELANIFPGKLGYYSKGTQESFLTTGLLELPWVGLGFDHRWNLPALMRSKVLEPHSGFVQGNFDQALLHADLPSLKKYTQAYLQTWQELTPQQRAGWVCGLGHGVLPKTPESHVKYFIQAMREGLS